MSQASVPWSLSTRQPQRSPASICHSCSWPSPASSKPQPGSSRLWWLWWLWPPRIGPAAAKPKSGGEGSPAAQLRQLPRTRSRSQSGSEPWDLWEETPPQHCGALGGDRLVTDGGGAPRAGRLLPAPAVGLAEPCQQQRSVPGSGFVWHKTFPAVPRAG